MGYLVCNKCKSYYELQAGEKPEDFYLECECGGKYIYSESLDVLDADFTESEATITCPKCGTENPEDAKLCKSCKKILKLIKAPPTTNDSPKKLGGFFDKWNEQSTPIKAGSIIGVCCLGLILIVGVMGLILPDAEPLSGTELEKYKASAKEISFAELNKNPDKYKGEHVKFTGEVVQIMESSGKTTFRLAVTKNEYGWSYSDIILVVYKAETPIVEKNIVTVYGDVYGSYTYESIIGAQITLPRINARYIEKLKDKEDTSTRTMPYDQGSSSNYTPTSTDTSNYSISNTT